MLNEPGNFQADGNAMPALDEHDELTEPIRYSDFSAFAPTTPNDSTGPDEEDIPSPRSSTQPLPPQYAQLPQIIPNGPQYVVGNGAVSPYLPPRPIDHNGNRPAGGLPVQRKSENASKQGRKVQRNLIPIAVGMCFVAVQVLLLLRFILKLLSISPDISWVGVIYTMSSVFVLPFRLLFLQLTIPLLFTVEIYTLLAILIYGIISRIIVRTLKILLRLWVH